MKRRFQILVVAMLGIAGMLPAAPPVQAASGCGLWFYCQYNWYTDSSWTALVGQRTTYCGGASTFWGEVTGFRETISYDCNGPAAH